MREEFTRWYATEMACPAVSELPMLRVILLFAVAMLEMDAVVPATVTDQSDEVGIEGLAKVQPPLMLRLTKVCPTAGASSTSGLASRIKTAADADMSVEFCSM